MNEWILVSIDQKSKVLFVACIAYKDVKTIDVLRIRLQYYISLIL